MNINKIINENAITLKPEGWLDTTGAEEMGKLARDIESASALILDLSKVEYISSAGLRQVVACSKKAKELGAAFSVINAGEQVMSIFVLTGLDKKLDISAL